jgi:CAP12/Pycsar effector protein, TIR domain
MFEDVGKRQIFVGSSTEGKKLAEIVISKLEDSGLQPLPWFDFFKNQRPPIQELEQISLRAEGAVLVATSDDHVVIRNQQWTQARDNVLFEYGLFSGALGRAKCGLLVPDQPDFRIPTDFLGVACFTSYSEATASECATKLVASLTSVLSKPAMAETLVSRGRRILCLIGWVRDETFRLVRDWESMSARSIVSERLKAVSGFLQQDIDALQLRKEYDAVEGLVIAAVDSFPSPPDSDERARYLDEFLFHRRNFANPTVFYSLLESLPRDLRHECACPTCRDCWEKFSERWPNRPEDLGQYRGYLGTLTGYHYSLYLYSYPCYATLYALGVAEATTGFEEIMRRADPMRALREWAERQLPPLNEAIVTFERRLHECLFGALDTRSAASTSP